MGVQGLNERLMQLRDQHGAAVARLVAAAELKGIDITLDGGTLFYSACWRGGDVAAAFVEELRELEKLGVELARVRAPQPCRATRPALRVPVQSP
jgi:hypothetical protein